MIRLLVAISLLPLASPQVSASPASEPSLPCEEGATVDLTYNRFAECSFLTGDDLDRFEFEAEAGDPLRVSMTGLTTRLDLEVELRDPAGAVIATEICTTPNNVTCRLTFDVIAQQTGTYSLVASEIDFNDTGDYRIGVTRLRAAAFGPQLPFDFGFESRLDPADDLDVFALRPEVEMVTEIVLQGLTTQMDMRIEVYGPDDSLIADEFCETPNNVTCFVSLENVDLVPGAYTIVVSDLEQDNAGDYRLTAICVFSPDGCPNDQDHDLVEDGIDSCILRPNADQRDTDGDGIGNACDADLNGDCIVDGVDTNLFANALIANDLNADFNGDGTVDLRDFAVLRARLLQTPGPSSATCLPLE